MKRIIGLSIIVFLILGIFSFPAMADDDVIKVMTRNQYLGANLDKLITAPPGNFLFEAGEALKQVAANNFRLRAQRLAAEVALTKPDVIALQEVYNFTLNGVNEEPPSPFINHLVETLKALDSYGQRYEVAAFLENLDVTIPLDPLDSDGDGDIQEVRVLDRDVILVREGTVFKTLSGEYTDDGLCGVPIPNFGPASTTSEDGCNFTFRLEILSPFPLLVPPIIVERGFVGIDVTVRGREYRIVNTHLEQKLIELGAPIFQSLQAVLLMGTLQFTTPDDTTLILLGDFNSSPVDSTGEITPYQTIVGSGYTDIWDTSPFVIFDPDGFTCCEKPELDNLFSIQDERVDLIFVNKESFDSMAFVTGRVPLFPLSQPPNWASDHGGVFGRLMFD